MLLPHKCSQDTSVNVFSKRMLFGINVLDVNMYKVVPQCAMYANSYKLYCWPELLSSWDQMNDFHIYLKMSHFSYKVKNGYNEHQFVEHEWK